MPESTKTSAGVVNISGYLFVHLDRLEERRKQLRQVVQACDLRGTILLSPEGINLFLAGERLSIDRFLSELRSDTLFAAFEVKESLSDYQPFNRMLIKIKSEIISFGIEGIDPVCRTSRKLPATELRKWLDEGRTVHLLDTRNNYEVEIGTFENAIPADIDSFRDFPEAVKRLPEQLRDEPVVMFCTGGIRCEKAGPYMEQAGFRQVFQLDGGILKYFEDCGGAHYDGDCFVFDQRVALDPQLHETEYTQCYVCQEVVSPDDQKSEKYVAGHSCPRCWREPDELLKEKLNQRNQQLQKIVTPLPGSAPYFNRRPLNVPQRFDGLSLIDFLCRWHPQVARDEWLRKITAAEIVPGQRYGRRRRRSKAPEEVLPLSPDRIVRAGQRFENLLPGTVEPDVNPAIRILFEDDEFVVIDKPAPLPLHPSGRFNRNTLHYILDQLYRPEHPLIVHRLDANTSGVLVLCRTRAVARIVQPQFESQTARKTYFALVHGHPPDEFFRCDKPISSKPGERGLRLPCSRGNAAHTEFHVRHTFDDATSLLEVIPRTGRTNQIRVHLWHLGFPVVGDPAYLVDGRTGSNTTLPAGGQAMCLHAQRIQLHDSQGELRDFSAPMPLWAGDSASAPDRGSRMQGASARD